MFAENWTTFSKSRQVDLRWQVHGQYRGDIQADHKLYNKYPDRRFRRSPATNGLQRTNASWTNRGSFRKQQIIVPMNHALLIIIIMFLRTEPLEKKLVFQKQKKNILMIKNNDKSTKQSDRSIAKLKSIHARSVKFSIDMIVWKRGLYILYANFVRLNEHWLFYWK